MKLSVKAGPGAASGAEDRLSGDPVMCLLAATSPLDRGVAL
jgi:hypothetical protein